MSGETCASGVPDRALCDDPEALLPARRHGLVLDALDHGGRRRLGRQPGEQRVDRVGRALDLDHRAAGVVAHEPVEAQLDGQPVHVRPEADALDDALHPHPHAPAIREVAHASR